MRKFFLSPNGTYVKTTKPTLHWDSIRGVENYKVSIYDYRDNNIASAHIRGNSWTSDKELTPGIPYRWKVTPLDKNGVELSFGNQPLQGSFVVLNSAQQKRVIDVEKSEQSPSLKIARAYLKNALFEDAITELENYLTVNPNSKEAKRLLNWAKNPQKIAESKKN